MWGAPLLKRPLVCGGRGAAERGTPGVRSEGTESKDRVRGRPQGGVAGEGGQAGWPENTTSQGGAISSLASLRWARMSVTAAMSSRGSIAVCGTRKGGGRGCQSTALGRPGHHLPLQ